MQCYTFFFFNITHRLKIFQAMLARVNEPFTTFIDLVNEITLLHLKLLLHKQIADETPREETALLPRHYQ